MRPEEEFPEGRTVRRDFARAVMMFAFVAFSIGCFLLGCLFLFRFFVHLILGLPVDDPCCPNLLNCRPCEKTSGAHYPYLLIALVSYFLGAGPWLAAYLYRRSEASKR